MKDQKALDAITKAVKEAALAEARKVMGGRSTIDAKELAVLLQKKEQDMLRLAERVVWYTVSYIHGQHLLDKMEEIGGTTVGEDIRALAFDALQVGASTKDHVQALEAGINDWREVESSHIATAKGEN